MTINEVTRRATDGVAIITEFIVHYVHVKTLAEGT